MARRVLAGVVRRPHVVAAAVLCVALAWLLSSALFSSRILASEDALLLQTPWAVEKPADLTRAHNDFLYDAEFMFHPDMLFARADLRSLRLPTWDPYLGGGDPLLASQQHAMLSPFNWPLSIFPFWQTLEWVAFLKLFAAGFGLFLLLRRLGLRPAAALLGGVAFACGSNLVDWLSHPHASTYAALPWLMLFEDRLAERGRARDALLVAVGVGAVLLGGHPPSMVIDGSVAVPWFVYRLAHWQRISARGRAAGRTALLYAGGALLGAAIAAVVLLPAIELAHQSLPRGGDGDGQPKRLLLSFVAPELWGRPDKFELGGGPLNYIERTGYFGVIPVLLAAAGFTRRPRGPQVFFALAGALALGIVIQVPLWTRIAGNLPTLHDINRNRYLIVVALAGAALAAYGVERLFEASRRQAAIALGVVALVAGIPLLWLVGHSEVLPFWRKALQQLPTVGATPIPRQTLELAAFLRWALFAALGTAAVALVAIRPRLAPLAAMLLVAFTAVDLVSYNRGFQTTIPAAWVRPAAPDTQRYVQRHIGHQRMAGYVEFGPNVASRYALRDARIYRVPDLKRRTALWSGLGGEGPDYELLPAGAGKLADLYAVRYAFEPDLVSDRSGQWRPRSSWPLVENVQAFPRAWLAYAWRPAKDMNAALAQVQAGDARQDLREPVIEGAPASRAPAIPAGPARFVQDGERTVTLSVDARRPAQLILDDTYYPGWTARVDGREVPIRPANVAFRAVAVPAGRHTIRFSYEPASVKIGALLSLLGMLTVAGGLLTPPLLRRRRGGRGRRGEAAA